MLVRCLTNRFTTHKHDAVGRWLKRHRRFQLHYTPTSSSWLNLVERWFREITEERIRRGSFYSVAELEQAIKEYLVHNHRQPKPFVWTASVAKILEKVNRCKGISEAPNIRTGTLDFRDLHWTDDPRTQLDASGRWWSSAGNAPSGGNRRMAWSPADLRRCSIQL